jgi:hypothetical protein
MPWHFEFLPPRWGEGVCIGVVFDPKRIHFLSKEIRNILFELGRGGEVVRTNAGFACGMNMRADVIGKNRLFWFGSRSCAAEGSPPRR